MTSPAATSRADNALRRAGIDPDAIRAILARHPLARVELFGSLLRDDYRPDSDLDLLYSFIPDQIPPWGSTVELEQELQQATGRPVHLTSRPGIERSRNAIRKSMILDSATLLHERP